MQLGHQVYRRRSNCIPYYTGSMARRSATPKSHHLSFHRWRHHLYHRFLRDLVGQASHCRYINLHPRGFEGYVLRPLEVFSTSIREICHVRRRIVENAVGLCPYCTLLLD